MIQITPVGCWNSFPELGIMHNGVGADPLRTSTVQQRTIPCRADRGAGPRARRSLFRVCETKWGRDTFTISISGRVTIAQYTKDGSPAGITSLVREIAADFAKAGITAKTEPDLGTARWKKLVWNVPYSWPFGGAVGINRRSQQESPFTQACRPAHGGGGRRRTCLRPPH